MHLLFKTVLTAETAFKQPEGERRQLRLGVQLSGRVEAVWVVGLNPGARSWLIDITPASMCKASGF